MDFSKFVEEVRCALEHKVEREVTVESVLKNNGIRLHGVRIVEKNKGIAPVIYLEEYYNWYLSGRSIKEIADSIIKANAKYCVRDEAILGNVRNFDKVKDKIEFRMLNKEMNRDLLSSSPYVEFLDMVIVFVVTFKISEYSEGTMVVNHVIMNEWGVGVEDLYKLAKKNSPAHSEVVIRRVNDMIREMIIHKLETECLCMEEKIVFTKELEELEIGDEEEMYALTNCDMQYGATCILYEGVLRDFANKVESDVFIIPSSLNEVLLIPAKNADDV